MTQSHLWRCESQDPFEIYNLLNASGTKGSLILIEKSFAQLAIFFRCIVELPAGIQYYQLAFNRLSSQQSWCNHGQWSPSFGIQMVTQMQGWSPLMASMKCVA